MSLFVGKIRKAKYPHPHCDPLYGRFMDELGLPLLRMADRSREEPAPESEAKALLGQTLQKCKKWMPRCRSYQQDAPQDEGYFGTLLKLRQQMERGEWCEACYTLCKTMKYYCANDVRTMYTIIGILEEFV